MRVNPDSSSAVMRTSKFRHEFQLRSTLAGQVFVSADLRQVHTTTTLENHSKLVNDKQ